MQRRIGSKTKPQKDAARLALLIGRRKKTGQREYCHRDSGGQGGGMGVASDLERGTPSEAYRDRIDWDT